MTDTNQKNKYGQASAAQMDANKKMTEGKSSQNHKNTNVQCTTSLGNYLRDRGKEIHKIVTYGHDFYVTRAFRLGSYSSSHYFHGAFD